MVSILRHFSFIITPLPIRHWSPDVDALRVMIALFISLSSLSLSAFSISAASSLFFARLHVIIFPCCHCFIAFHWLGRFRFVRRHQYKWLVIPYHQSRQYHHWGLINNNTVHNSQWGNNINDTVTTIFFTLSILLIVSLGYFLCHYFIIYISLSLLQA